METIEEMFTRTMNRVLRLKLGLDIYDYTLKKQLENYRELEAELDVNYPIKGTAVRFSSDSFIKWTSTSDNYKIVDDNKDMSSIDITDAQASEPFRYKEMTFVYLFTVLEDFGNSIISLVNNNFYTSEIQKGKSWHSKVNKYAKADGKDLVKGFADPFNLQKIDIDEKYVNLLFNLKQTRNSIAHELQYPEIDNFKTDVHSLIIMICYLFHINNPAKSTISVYPWPDYNNSDTL